MQNPRVTFQMNTGRTIVLELLPDQAPNTCLLYTSRCV